MSRLPDNPINNPDNTIAIYQARGLVEILGPETAASFNTQMEGEPGDALANGIMVRVGRAGFHYWLKQEGDALEEANPDFHLSPIKKKITDGLEHICSVLSSAKINAPVLKNHPDTWELELSGVEGAMVPSRDCCFIFGFVQEFASWAGMGKLYQVSEMPGTRCSKIIIRKDPVE